MFKMVLRINSITSWSSTYNERIVVNVPSLTPGEHPQLLRRHENSSFPAHSLRSRTILFQLSLVFTPVRRVSG